MLPTTIFIKASWVPMQKIVSTLDIIVAQARTLGYQDLLPSWKLGSQEFLNWPREGKLLWLNQASMCVKCSQLDQPLYQTWNWGYWDDQFGEDTKEDDQEEYHDLTL